MKNRNSLPEPKRPIVVSGFTRLLLVLEGDNRIAAANPQSAGIAYGSDSAAAFSAIGLRRSMTTTRDLAISHVRRWSRILIRINQQFSRLTGDRARSQSVISNPWIASPSIARDLLCFSTFRENPM
jgi:hypothetical protein